MDLFVNLYDSATSNAMPASIKFLSSKGFPQSKMPAGNGAPSILSSCNAFVGIAREGIDNSLSAAIPLEGHKTIPKSEASCCFGGGPCNYEIKPIVT